MSNNLDAPNILNMLN